MATDKPTPATELDLNRLEFRIAELIEVCERLKDENRSLRAQQQTLANERATLIEKNDQVRVRVEAMINRLRAMERSA
ncbi:MAG: TIGR02449 family protein [Gammaproteobacteria bacterium]